MKPAFLIVAAAVLLCGCTRNMVYAERVRTFTVAHEKSKSETYNATEIWISETFVSAKAVIDVRQPDAGTIIGKTTINGNNGAVIPAMYSFDAAFKFVGSDHSTSITATITGLWGNDYSYQEPVIQSVNSQVSGLIDSYAKAMGGRVIASSPLPVITPPQQNPDPPRQDP